MVTAHDSRTTRYVLCLEQWTATCQGVGSFMFTGLVRCTAPVQHGPAALFYSSCGPLIVLVVLFLPTKRKEVPFVCFCNMKHRSFCPTRRVCQKVYGIVWRFLRNKNLGNFLWTGFMTPATAVPRFGSDLMELVVEAALSPQSLAGGMLKHVETR